MARPCKKAGTIRVDITLSLTIGEDDDLIDWFASLPGRQRATAVITRLRTGAGEQKTAVVDDDGGSVELLAALLM